MDANQNRYTRIPNKTELVQLVLLLIYCHVPSMQINRTRFWDRRNAKGRKRKGNCGAAPRHYFRVLWIASLPLCPPRYYHGNHYAQFMTRLRRIDRCVHPKTPVSHIFLTTIKVFHWLFWQESRNCHGHVTLFQPKLLNEAKSPGVTYLILFFEKWAFFYSAFEYR